MYTLFQLQEEFNLIKASNTFGVSGVVVFDSGKHGPCVGITTQTHGNEPSGLAASRYFRENEMVNKLTKGSVMFVVNNIKAAQQYFNALCMEDVEKSKKAKRLARLCDINMNRLPEDVLELADDTRYEIRRAQELREVWRRFDVGLDIHTTSATIEPMIIAIGDVDSSLYKGFPMGIVIRNIENIQTGIPACALYGELGKTPVIGVEAGLHEETASFELAIKLVNTLLRNLDMISDDQDPDQAHAYKEYSINGSVFFPNESYELVKKFSSFELIEAGVVIAIGDSDPIKVFSACHAVMPPPDTRPSAPISDEVMFLSEPVKTIMM